MGSMGFYVLCWRLASTNELLWTSDGLSSGFIGTSGILSDLSCHGLYGLLWENVDFFGVLGTYEHF